MKKQRSKRGHAKPKAKKRMPAFRKTSLPDTHVKKKSAGRGTKKEQHREDFDKQVDQSESRNTSGKEDFDDLLKAFLET